MPTTYVDDIADAGQTDFAFTFPYLEDEHVVVEIDGVQKTLTTDYTIVTSPSTKIVLTSGATAGQVVRVRRKSQPGTDLVDFENGSVLTESELDRAYLHNRYLNEEIGELNDASLQKEAGGTDWDAGGSKIKNVGSPTLTADATTKQYVDDKVNQLSSGASAPPTKWVFTGTAGANTTYSVTDAEVNGDTAYDVSVDGSVLEPTTDYTVNPDTDTLTIVSTLSGGEDIVVIERGFGVAITGTIGADQLQSNAVTTAKINNSAVTTAKIADDAVTTAKIADDAVTNSKIADDAVDTDQLADHSVTAVKISNTDPIFNVQTDGQVGIGTDIPQHILDVRSSEDLTTFVGTQTPGVGIKNENTAVDNVALLAFKSSEANTVLAGVGMINRAVAPTANASVGDLAFYSKPSGVSYLNDSPSMLIDSNGNVGIGTTSPSAPLEVASTTGGVVFPRLTTTQRDAISSPTDGETIFNSTTAQLESYNGSEWVVASSGVRAKTSFQGVTTVTRNTNAESNISSVSRTGTGQYTVTFSTAIEDPVVSFSCGRTTSGAMFRYTYLLKNGSGTTVYSGAVASMDISIADAGDPRDGELVQILVF
jgi:hypothetical protein